MARAIDRKPVSTRGRARRAWRLGLWIAALLAVGAAPPVGAMDELQFFRIGTAATTGTYFQIGGILASAITKPPGSRDCEHGGSCGVPNLVAVAQATQGSVQNVLAVDGKQLESALAQSDVTFWAYTDTWMQPRRCSASKESGSKAMSTIATLLKNRGPLKGLRVIAGLYPEDVHIVVRAESTIHELRDLKGKRVALGEPESGTLADSRIVLEAAGLSECDLKAEYARLSEAAEALAQGRIDALFITGGYPLPAITDIAATVATRLVPIPRELSERLAHAYPFFAIDVIPSGTYPGVDDDTPTLSTTALWLVGEDVSEETVYSITKALWSEPTKRLLEAAHPVGKRIRLANALDGVAIPLHPGAARYYRGAGFKLPEGQ